MKRLTIEYEDGRTLAFVAMPGTGRWLREFDGRPRPESSLAPGITDGDVVLATVEGVLAARNPLPGPGEPGGVAVGSCYAQSRAGRACGLERGHAGKHSWERPLREAVA